MGISQAVNIHFTKTNIMKNGFFLLLLFAISHFVNAQPCTDIVLDFDGVDDLVQLAPSPIAGNQPFTVEARFISTATGPGASCSGNFRRLFSFIGPSRRLEVGECGGTPAIFWASSSGPSFPATTFGPNIRDGVCHHLALVFSGGTITVYLDGVQVFNQAVLGNFSPLSAFRAGQWGGSLAPGENWQGPIDEVRLWTLARSQAQIDANRLTRLTGTEAGLAAYWQMEQGTPGGNNTGITQAVDLTGNGNNGTLFSFALNGATSNFACSGCDNYEVVIKDYATRSIDLTEICSGGPVHFCLERNADVPVGSASCYSVLWEYTDGTGWTALPTSIFSGLCFPVPAGTIALDCASSTTGFVDLFYRATITLPDGCAYTTDPYQLRVCCPLSPVSISLSPSTALCEGDNATISATLTSPDLFVSNPAGQVSIVWTLPGGSQVANVSSLNYQVTNASHPEVCFTVTVSNCAAKDVTASACITVDKEPKCGAITGMPVPSNLIPDASDPNLYYICPGGDAAVGVATPFTDCNKSWQYSFDQINWTGLGISNNVQNTNILPSYYWPAGATSIYYRIECQPLSSPSGCMPCYSNTLEIRLLTPPLPDVITGDDQICKGDFSLLSVSNPVSGLQYTWFWNGAEVGTGTSYAATQGGCYWVEITNGCQVTETPWFCLEVCEIVPIISCPLPPNECAYVHRGPIFLSACDSDFAEPSASCADNSGFVYTWTWTDGSGNPQSATGCSLTDTPALTGTIYYLSIFDPASGCSASKEITITPCDRDKKL
jgi:hypothetical protein